MAHGYSEWSNINSDRLPVAVAYPKSTEEVVAIAKICTQHKIPISEYHAQTSKILRDVQMEIRI